MIRGDDEVAAIRQARADQQQQMLQQQNAATAAQTAKTLAETPVEGDTALNAIMS